MQSGYTESVKVNLIPLSVIILKLINVLEWHAENVLNVKKKLLGQSSNQWTAIIMLEHIGKDKRESFNAISSRTNHSDCCQSAESTKNLSALVLSSVVVLTLSFPFLLFRICTV
jgi:hypothetical protein